MSKVKVYNTNVLESLKKTSGLNRFGVGDTTNQIKLKNLSGKTPVYSTASQKDIVYGLGGTAPPAFDPLTDATTQHAYVMPISGLSADDAIGTWPDSVGSADATQAVAAKKPTYKTSVQNGQDAASFDGGDCLQSAAFASEMSQPNTIYVVGNQVPEPPAFTMFMSGIIAGSRHQFFYRQASGYGLSMYAGTDLMSIDGVYNQFILLGGIFNGASSYLYRDGNEIKSGNVGTQSITGITIGAYYNGTNYFFTGYLGDIFACSTAHDATKRGNFETWIDNKWAPPGM